jgi:hypothetical protein
MKRRNSKMANEVAKARESRLRIVERMTGIGKALARAEQLELRNQFKQLEEKLRRQDTCGETWQAEDKRINDLLDKTESSIRSNSWGIIPNDCKRLESMITNRSREVRGVIEKKGFLAWLSGQQVESTFIGSYEKLSISELEGIKRDLENEIDNDERSMEGIEHDIEVAKLEQKKLQVEGSTVSKDNKVVLRRLESIYTRLKNQIKDYEIEHEKLYKKIDTNDFILRRLNDFIRNKEVPVKDWNSGGLRDAIEGQNVESEIQRERDKIALDMWNDVDESTGDYIDNLDSDFMAGVEQERLEVRELADEETKTRAELNSIIYEEIKCE